MAVEIRTITDDEVSAYREAVMTVRIRNREPAIRPRNNAPLVAASR
jgi:hypothetical protein